MYNADVPTVSTVNSFPETRAFDHPQDLVGIRCSVLQYFGCCFVTCSGLHPFRRMNDLSEGHLVMTSNWKTNNMLMGVPEGYDFNIN